MNGASIMVNQSGSTAEKKLDPDSTFIRNEETNIYILSGLFQYIGGYINIAPTLSLMLLDGAAIFRETTGITIDFINHNFKLEFINSDLYFVQVKNNFIFPLLRIGSGIWIRQVINQRIRILIPGFST